MPVIRGQAKVINLADENRKNLLKQLTKELSGKTSPDGPVIFEIPLLQSDRMDILVVWEAFRDLRSEDRTALILEAYKGRTSKIAQALGVTRQEAIEQSLLPYNVKPLFAGGRLPTNIGMDDVRKAMIEEGGYSPDGKNIVLCLPTSEMAEEAIFRLISRVPGVQWFYKHEPC